MASADDAALKAAQGVLHNILQDSPPCDAWYVKTWHPIGEHSLRRLVAYANSALALHAFFAGKSDTDGITLMERAPFHAWRVIRDPMALHAAQGALLPQARPPQAPPDRSNRITEKGTNS